MSRETAVGRPLPRTRGARTMDRMRLPDGAGARWKLAGLLLAGVPAALLALFTVGEVVSGDLSGLSHLLQVAPLIVMLAIAWRWPIPGGAAMAAMAVVLSAMYGALATENVATMTIVVVELLFFAPAVTAGLLFVRGGQLEARAR